MSFGIAREKRPPLGCVVRKAVIRHSDARAGGVHRRAAVSRPRRSRPPTRALRETVAVESSILDGREPGVRDSERVSPAALRAGSSDSPLRERVTRVVTGEDPREDPIPW